MYFWAVALAGATLLGGCSKEDTPVDNAVAVNFNSGIQIRTAAGGDSWLETDQVGIFMLTAGGNLTADITSRADNVQYNVSDAATGALSPTSGTPIYYPQSGNVDFIAYYPYGTVTADYTYNVSVAGQIGEAAQSALDVLYAKAANAAKTNTAVNLAFGHVLNKVTLNVALGDGLTSLTGDQITAAVFSGMPQTAMLTLQDATLTAGAIGNFPALKASAPAATSAATFTALLIPQAVNAYTGRTLIFTMNGKDYIWNIPDTETFTAGNHYTYPVTVGLSGVTVGAPTITDWNINDNGTGTTTVGIERVKIPAGTFLMGSPTTEPSSSDRERPQHDVNIGEFWMSKYEITNAQYAAFLNAKGIGSDGQGSVTYDNNGTPTTETQSFVSLNRIEIRHDGSVWKIDGYWGQCPVFGVTWYGATAFAAWVGGRLPTEAEWEYACRAGTTTPFGIGDGTKLYADMANFYGLYPYELPGGHIEGYDGSDGHPNTSLSRPTTPGSYPYANAWGLYDMHGNVWEWTSDYWTDSYSEADMQNPDTSRRVLRGGGALDGFARICRSAYRYSRTPEDGPIYTGFRVAFAL